jgi:copper resistance protein D
MTTRAIHYLLLLGLFGSTLFALIGLRGVDRPAHWPGAALMAIAAPLVSALLMLVSIAAMMGQTLAMLEWSNIEAILVSTTMGWAFGVRMVLLVGGAVLLRRAPWAAAAAYGLALATLPWSGHAAAGEGLVGALHRLNDAVHLLAAGLWIGAIGWFALLTRQARRGKAPLEPLFDAMQRFAPLGVALVAIVSLTGLLNAELIFGLAQSGTVLSTTYGQLLVLKIALVGLMLLFAASHAARVRRLATPATLASVRTSLRRALSPTMKRGDDP